MKRVPGAGDVYRALAAALREAAKCLNGINRQAGVFVSRGAYDDAEALVKAGRAVSDFQLRLDALRREWRSIRALPNGGADDDEEVPLWRSYVPILQALVGLGGSASRGELADHLSSSKSSSDPDAAGGSRSDWMRKLGRARRPLVHEGFLEANPSIWRITDAGRQAARDEG